MLQRAANQASRHYWGAGTCGEVGWRARKSTTDDSAQAESFS
jgi:hypothetical protein